MPGTFISLVLIIKLYVIGSNHYTRIATEIRDRTTLVKPRIVAFLEHLPLLISRLWRGIATVSLFGLFGLISLLLSLIALPLLFLFIRDSTQRRSAGRLAVSGACWLFIRAMSLMGVLRYTINGRETVTSSKGLLIVANHPTLIDGLFLLSVFRNSTCVVKQQIFAHRITRFVVNFIGYLSNNDPVEVITQSIAILREGGNLIFFPEGTRSTVGKPLDFSRGAATIAIRSHATVVPIAIQCSPPTLHKSSPWYAVPQTRVRFEVNILDTIDVADFVKNAENERSASVALNNHLLSSITKTTKGGLRENT